MLPQGKVGDVRVAPQELRHAFAEAGLDGGVCGVGARCFEAGRDMDAGDFTRLTEVVTGFLPSPKSSLTSGA